MSDDRYARHYWRFADEFPDVYDNDAALALWYRLVRLADMAWPAAGTLPYGVNKNALAKLTQPREGGPLIEMVTRVAFRVRGMDKERAKRSQSGRDAADARWRNAPGNADGNAERIADSNAKRSAASNAETMPSREEERREEQSRGEREGVARAPNAGDAFFQRTGEYPSSKILEWLNDLASEAGGGDVDAGEVRVAALIDATPLTENRRQYLGHIRDLIRAENHAAEKREAQDERRRLAEKRAQPETRLSDNPEYQRVLAEISKPRAAAS